MFTIRCDPLVLSLAFLSAFILQSASAAGKDEWRTRSIYQVMVDRYARPDNSTTAPCNVTERAYCGGTWKGLMYNLDYIQGMGFDAIWISPMSSGVTGMTGDGSDYTGYWVTDMDSPNPNFGTQNDLIALSNEIHNRGIVLFSLAGC
jgi:alpha-amylase